MKYLMSFALVIALITLRYSQASACDQKFVLHYFNLSQQQMRAKQFSAAQQAVTEEMSVVQACVAQTTGHAQRHYQLVEASTFFELAFLIDQDPKGDRAKESAYERKALSLVAPLQVAKDTNLYEKRGARAIQITPMLLKNYSG